MRRSILINFGPAIPSSTVNADISFHTVSSPKEMKYNRLLVVTDWQKDGSPVVCRGNDCLQSRKLVDDKRHCDKKKENKRIMIIIYHERGKKAKNEMDHRLHFSFRVNVLLKKRGAFSAPFRLWWLIVCLPSTFFVKIYSPYIINHCSMETRKSLWISLKKLQPPITTFVFCCL